MPRHSLTEQEMASWLRFRHTAEEASLRVSRELFAQTQITGGQFGILNILASQRNGELRQQRLADAMRWDRTRLSHQLSRMVTRGLVSKRKQHREGTLIQLTELGKTELERIRPAQAELVRKHYLDRLNPSLLKAVDELALALRDA